VISMKLGGNIRRVSWYCENGSQDNRSVVRVQDHSTTKCIFCGERIHFDGVALKLTCCLSTACSGVL